MYSAFYVVPLTEYLGQMCNVLKTKQFALNQDFCSFNLHFHFFSSIWINHFSNSKWNKGERAEAATAMIFKDLISNICFVLFLIDFFSLINNNRNHCLRSTKLFPPIQSLFFSLHGVIEFYGHGLCKMDEKTTRIFGWLERSVNTCW